MTLHEVNWLNAPPPSPDSGLVVPYKTGEYYGPTALVRNGTTVARAVNQLESLPFFVTKTTTFDRLALLCSGEQNGGNATWGLYGDDDYGYPGAKVIDVQLNITSTGLKAVNINLTLEPGLYWTAVSQEDRPTFSMPFLVGTGSTGPQTWGMPANTGGGSLPTHFTLNRTYTAALPNTFPTGAGIGGGTTPLVLLRAA